MGIKIGTVFTGTVDQVDDESIQTKFFMLGVPLIPLESFFVLRDRGNGVDGFPIALHGKSVAMAYLRWGAFIAAVIAGVSAAVTPSYRRGPGSFVLAGCLIAAWVVFTFFLGRPNAAARARRMVFKAATGVSAPPDLLPADLAQRIYESLQKNPLHANAAWRFVSSSYQAHLEHSDQARAAAEAAWLELSGGAGVIGEDQRRE